MRCCKTLGFQGKEVRKGNQSETQLKGPKEETCASEGKPNAKRERRERLGKEWMGRGRREKN